MRRHRRDLEIMSEMNLTNLLDTAFTLLMAFMLVAPMLKTGIDLRLPSVGGSQLATEQKTLTISVAKPQMEGQSARLYLDDSRVTLEELEQALVETKNLHGENFSVVIEGDAEVYYETVAQILSLLKKQRIPRVGLITETASTKSGPESDEITEDVTE